MRLIDADKLLTHLNDCALSASPGSGSLRELMLARAEYNAIQNCMKAVEEQPTAYDTNKVIEGLKDSAIEFEAFGICSDYVEITTAIDIVKGGVLDAYD